jgi:hypothetical protein
MRDAETTIERVLTGLRDVDVPVGMEGRVLATMEEREASRAGWSGWSWFGERPAVAMLGCGAAVATLVAVALFLPAVRHTWEAQPAAPVATEVPTEVPKEIKTAPENVATVKAKIERQTGAHAGGAETMKRTEVAKKVATDDSDAVAAEEMQAASCPAPPVP